MMSVAIETIANMTSNENEATLSAVDINVFLPHFSMIRNSTLDS